MNVWRRQIARGFTLIELLVVVAIIGILGALLLAAVQASRESARASHCANQLREIGSAMIAHQDAQKFLPTNGWGYSWLGDPDRGYDRKQPGGWIFNILPFIEQGSVRELGAGLAATSKARKTAAATRIMTVLPGFVCPGRRQPKLLPVFYGVSPPKYTDLVTQAARSDYAANGGDVHCEFRLDPTHGLDPRGPADFTAATNPTWGEEFARLAHVCDGVAFPQSRVRLNQIVDGASKTYLVGEKYLTPDNYTNGLDTGDNDTLYIGSNEDIVRWTYISPQHDSGDMVSALIFGGPHAGAFNMVFCDGSVQRISYEIDADLHRQLGNRADGMPLSSLSP